MRKYYLLFYVLAIGVARIAKTQINKMMQLLVHGALSVKMDFQIMNVRNQMMMMSSTYPGHL